jgi:hypothetical protein
MFSWIPRLLRLVLEHVQENEHVKLFKAATACATDRSWRDIFKSMTGSPKMQDSVTGNLVDLHLVR